MMKTLSAQDGFLGLPAEYDVSYDNAQVVIIPFGLEASVSYGGGTRLGPQAMIDASHNLELFDEHFWCEPASRFNIATVAAPEIAQDIPEALDKLATLTGQVLADGKLPFVFGGEHSITAGAIRPFCEQYQDLVIVHFDAHADLRDGYDGEHFSHASALRRCLDYPDVELISFGIRSISAGEIPFLEANRERIQIHFSKDKARWDLEQILAPIKGRPVYLTFDIDGLDSSLMPATGTPEPGGLFWQEAIDIIEMACRYGNVVGADVNELAPIKGFPAYDFLAAKLAYKMMSFSLLSK